MTNLYHSYSYYLGQHDDARMNVALALTAAREGATVANHVEVVSLLKEQQTKTNEDGGTETKQMLCGARMRDTISGKEWETQARVVVNATGPFTDHVRTMDNPNVTKICQPSAGVHIVLPSYYRLVNLRISLFTLLDCVSSLLLVPSQWDCWTQLPVMGE